MMGITEPNETILEELQVAAEKYALGDESLCRCLYRHEKELLSTTIASKKASLNEELKSLEDLLKQVKDPGRASALKRHIEVIKDYWGRLHSLHLQIMRMPACD